jgi:hypothetical protein
VVGCERLVGCELYLLAVVVVAVTSRSRRFVRRWT